MATVNLLPNGSGINTFTLSTGSDVAALLQDDASTPAGDSNYLSATVAGKLCFLTLDDFTEDHSSIDGVQIVLRAGNGARTQTYDIETNYYLQVWVSIMLNLQEQKILIDSI